MDQPTTPPNFDLDAAWFRQAEQNSAGFLSRFAYLLKEALPQHTTIAIQSRGLFKKTTEVVGVKVAFENDCYSMQTSQHGTLSTLVEKKVRGVVLSTRPVAVDAWMKGLFDSLHQHTQQASAVVNLLKNM
jgi:hypothetical protein